MYGLKQRWMLANDIDEILEIESLTFDDPWTEKDIHRFIKTGCNICRVATVNNEIVGYMFYELNKTRFIIHRIAVHSSCWGMGAGSFLIGVLVDHLSKDRRCEISLMIRERNLGAQLFFQKIGFVCVDIAKEHYSKTKEDGYVFIRHIDPAEMTRRVGLLQWSNVLFLLCTRFATQALRKKLLKKRFCFRPYFINSVKNAYPEDEPEKVKAAKDE